MIYTPGQRVKRIKPFSVPDAWAPPGSVGTVRADDGGAFVVVAWDHKPSGGVGGACRDTLAPLTDPKADAFLESIRKLKPLHEEPKRTTTYGDLVDAVRRELQR